MMSEPAVLRMRRDLVTPVAEVESPRSPTPPMTLFKLVVAALSTGPELVQGTLVPMHGLVQAIDGRFYLFLLCMCPKFFSASALSTLFFLNDDFRTLRSIISISLVVDITVLPLPTLLILYHLSLSLAVFF